MCVGSGTGGHGYAYGVLPRVHADQDFRLPLLVSAMVVLYWAAVVWGVTPYTAPQGGKWRTTQEVFATFETAMALWCLWGCACTSPGAVPEGWNGSNHDPIDKELRWCRVCRNWKPARTHHCSQCNRCVPRYDHHCLWVDNCVGQANHKYFVLFLTYVAGCCVHYFYVLRVYMMDGSRVAVEVDGGVAVVSAEGWLSLLASVLLAVYSVAALGFCVFAVSFCGCTCWGVLRNMTAYDEATAAPDAPSYSNGIFNNLVEVVGPHPLLWPVPHRMPVALATEEALAHPSSPRRKD